MPGRSGVRQQSSFSLILARTDLAGNRVYAERQFDGGNYTTRLGISAWQTRSRPGFRPATFDAALVPLGPITTVDFQRTRIAANRPTAKRNFGRRTSKNQLTRSDSLLRFPISRYFFATLPRGLGQHQCTASRLLHVRRLSEKLFRLDTLYLAAVRGSTHKTAQFFRIVNSQKFSLAQPSKSGIIVAS